MDIAVSPRPMEILLVEDDPDDACRVVSRKLSRSVKRLTRAKRLLPRRCSRCNRRVNINVYKQ